MVVSKIVEKISYAWGLAFLASLLLIGQNAQASAHFSFGAGAIQDCFDFNETINSDGTSGGQTSGCLQGSRYNLGLSFTIFPIGENSPAVKAPAGNGDRYFFWNSLNSSGKRGGADNFFAFVLFVIIVVVVVGLVYALASYFSTRIDVGIALTYDTMYPKNLPEDYEIHHVRNLHTGISIRAFPGNVDRFYIGGTLSTLSEKITTGGSPRTVISNDGYSRRFQVGWQPMGDNGLYLEYQRESFSASPKPFSYLREGLKRPKKNLPLDRSRNAVILGLRFSSH